MSKPRLKRYSLIAKNRPGELAKLTELLEAEGVQPQRLTVASLGDDEAAIAFLAPPLPGFPESLSRHGLRMLPESGRP